MEPCVAGVTRGRPIYGLAYRDRRLFPGGPVVDSRCERGSHRGRGAGRVVGAGRTERRAGGTCPAPPSTGNWKPSRRGCWPTASVPLWIPLPRDPRTRRRSAGPAARRKRPPRLSDTGGSVSSADVAAPHGARRPRRETVKAPTPTRLDTPATPRAAGIAAAELARRHRGYAALSGRRLKAGCSMSNWRR